MGVSESAECQEVNGTLPLAMRVAPVGLFPEWFDDEDAFELGMRTGAITCGHVPGGQLYGACQGFNEIHITGFTD